MPLKIVSKDSSYVPPLEKLSGGQQNPAKRIRVSRACDTCRKRKVKCDGKQPCIHCTVYSYDCSYNHVRPTGNSGSVSDSSVNGSSVIASGASTQPPKKKKKKSSDKMDYTLMKQLFPEVKMENSSQCEVFCQVFNTLKATGPLDMKQVIIEYSRALNGESGPSSGVPSTGSSITDDLQRNPTTPGVSRMHDHIHDHMRIKIIFPPREIALKLIYKTWSESCVLFRFYHRPSFINDFNSLYETVPSEYTNHQNKILPLIYSVIAVGALFSKGDNAIDNQYLQDEGYRYFIAARKLLDITNTTDMESIQTIFMLTLFLQFSARLTTCYSYIGIALRSSLRQGLHRKSDPSDDCIVSECKKRLFWTIYKLEIYVNSILGLPNSVDEDDITCDLPLDVDDANIGKTQILPQLNGKLSSCGINNSHTKLILILNHIVKRLHKGPVFMVPHELFQSLEKELKIWKYELPYQLQPDGPTSIPQVYTMANRLLYLDYLYVQLMLYRPYIHYVKMVKLEATTDGSTMYQYQNGLQCFDISKKIIMLAQYMISGKLLNGSYWFSIYTIFFSVACLVYYLLEIDSTDEDVKRTIEIGKEILLLLKQRSMGAERIYNLLNQMFENYERQNLMVQDNQSQGRLVTSDSGTLLNRVDSIPTEQTQDTLDDNLDFFSKLLSGSLLEGGMNKGIDVWNDSPVSYTGSAKNSSDEHDHEFDWERFIDKEDLLSFDV